MTETKYVMVEAASLKAMDAKIDALDKLLRERMVQSQEPRWYSISEFAAIKKRSECTIRQWINAGQLQVRGKGGLREVRPNEND